MKGIKVSPVDMQERANLNIRAGDTVRVWIKIEEKGKTRLQPFEGLVIATKHGKEPGATFTVRKVASGVGVEKIFPLYSPAIDKIEVLRRAKVRRSKLYFVREKVAKQLRRVLRRSEDVYLATKGAAELEEERKRAEEELKKKQEEEQKQLEQQQEQEQQSQDTEDKNQDSQQQEETQEAENKQEDKENKEEVAESK